MSKKKFYLTLDTETATLPFVNELCENAREKKKISIAKPLVYDIGWVITDRKGNIYTTKNFLVQETFFVPSIFNTAYYKDKRPQYIQLLQEGKIIAKNWNDIIEILIEDLNACDIAAAYNAPFDFKKAIPFTEKYIKNLYSMDYTEWEEKQKENCLNILNGKKKNKNEDYLNPIFNLRGNEYPIVDLWNVACKNLINGQKYKEYCLKNDLLTDSKIYFSTSAETAFRYLMREHDFIEEHTALSDAIIESQILTKALHKNKVEPEIDSFPFQQLGTTVQFAESFPKYRGIVKAAIGLYLAANEDRFELNVGYWNRIKKMYESI